MNLPPNAILIIAAVFGVSFLMMIPVFIMQNRKKKNTQAYENANKNNAILHIYGDSPVIDGRKIKDMEFQKGTDLQYIVALAAGRHTLEAKYSTSDVSLTGKNVNYKTPKPITSELNLEAGYSYTVAIYFYSPEQRHTYYKGDVGEAVFSQKLDINGGAGVTSAYIICYKEKPL